MIIKNGTELLVALAVVCLMGAVGGLINGWWRAWRELAHRPNCRKDYCLFALCGSMSAIGVAALGIVAFSFFSHPDFGTQWIMLIFTTLFAGFFAQKWIPVIGEKLEDKLDLVKKTAEDAKKQSGAAMGYAQALVKAQAALKTKTKFELEEAIENMAMLLPMFDSDRMFCVTYARLLRWNSRVGDAIIVLRDLITQVNRDLKGGCPTALETSTLAVAYYNIACYHSILLDERPSEKDRLISEIREALGAAVMRCREYEDESRCDEDFSGAFKACPTLLDNLPYCH